MITCKATTAEQMRLEVTHWLIYQSEREDALANLERTKSGKMCVLARATAFREAAQFFNEMVLT